MLHFQCRYLSQRIVRFTVECKQKRFNNNITEIVWYDCVRLMLQLYWTRSLTLMFFSCVWLFTTVRGESWCASAQQSDGDCGSHEENQGKTKTQHCVFKTVSIHTHPQSNGDCFMMEHRNSIYNNIMYCHTQYKECAAFGCPLYRECGECRKKSNMRGGFLPEW